MFMLLMCLIVVLAISVVFAQEVLQKKQTLENVTAKEPAPANPEPGMRKRAMPKVFEEREEIVPSPFIVKHLDEGRATLMMRHRASKKACTAQLIIWSGRKKRHIRDSYYDLGMRSADGIGEEIIEAFIKEAQERIGELKSQGSRKKREKKVVAEVQAVAQPEALPVGAGATVSIEDNQKPEPAIKKKKFPSVFRGEILQEGFMPRALGDEVKDCYGVRYRTDEGVEDTVWGVNLKTELHNAKAGVGDVVEILKIGRKTMEKGKAPMNLYKVTKLSPEQIQA